MQSLKNILPTGLNVDNILLDTLPKSICGLEINTDFRYSIAFELLMSDKNLSDKEKIQQAFILYFKEPFAIKNQVEALEGILWFYSAGAATNKTQNREEKPIYSYEYDDIYIFSAFLSQYGIDLNRENLHWWKFKAMFQSLNEDHTISKIMKYRSMKISPKLSKEEKQFYRNMKRIYALPDEKTDEEKLNQLADLFG